VKPAAELIA